MTEIKPIVLKGITLALSGATVHLQFPATVVGCYGCYRILLDLRPVDVNGEAMIRVRVSRDGREWGSHLSPLLFDEIIQPAPEAK